MSVEPSNSPHTIHDDTSTCSGVGSQTTPATEQGDINTLPDGRFASDQIDQECKLAVSQMVERHTWTRFTIMYDGDKHRPEVFGRKEEIHYYEAEVELGGKTVGKLAGVVHFVGGFKVVDSATMNIFDFPESTFNCAVRIEDEARVISKSGVNPFTKRDAQAIQCDRSNRSVWIWYVRKSGIIEGALAAKSQVSTAVIAEDT
jgi:hypothetical protein